MDAHYVIKTAQNILNTDRPDTHTVQYKTPSIRNCTLSICAINVCGLMSKLNLGIHIIFRYNMYQSENDNKQDKKLLDVRKQERIYELGEVQ